MHKYWLCWFVASFSTFIVPEVWALVIGKPQNTLSAAVWALEGAQRGMPITAWTAAHFLFTGVFLLVSLWLAGHFGWYLWT